ncbi:MAG TPA: cyclopropane-fatty-acyl-phospholipid synthase family protein [Gammaproteobacteria bacterium]|nr:cyclopropane-fatty-acyl-phospholipid synthase family protein [Gammaproteobacteria bacterium]
MANKFQSIEQIIKDMQMLTKSSNAQVMGKVSAPLIFRSKNLERILVAVIDRLHLGRLTVSFPSGYVRTSVGKAEVLDGQPFRADWNLKSYRSIRRMFRNSDVGLAEAYMEGEWDSPELTNFLELMAINMDVLNSSIKDWRLVRMLNRLQHLLRSNTRRGSRKNIAYHYDLGNDFYGLWLDRGMTYSSGLFDEHHTDLSSAQENKYRQLAEELDLKPQHRVLEIGCGWGGFAEFAARNYGCKIVGITISHEQFAWARKRIEEAGLSDLVEIRFQDYRDVDGQFDRIVSIEMFEAVGEDHWPGYFEQIRQHLTPGGRAGLQIISISNEHFENYRGNTDFIQKYIFPGGMLPSEDILNAHVNRAGLIRLGQNNFGLSYARTLELWRRNFTQNWSSIEELGYSTKFKRMWEYYLCYCEAGFRRGTIDVGQYVLRKSREGEQSEAGAS